MRALMPTILVVDDDPSIRMMFARSLAEYGEVDQAEGGRPAISLVSTRRYDAILLDLHMPGSDGFAVLEALAKEDAINRDTPVFLVTGDMSNQARVRALKLRSLLFLTKPVPLAMIKSLVEKALEKRHSTRPPQTPRGTRKP
jgi:CheY-like chemotaxis protein